MISFGHTTFGVIVGVTAYHYLGQTNLAEGLILTSTIGFIFHYIADTIPHGHFLRFRKHKIKIVHIIIFDLFLSILLFSGIAYLKYGLNDKFLYILFGIGGSQMPDVIDGLIYSKTIKAKGIFKLEYALHRLTHWHGNGPKALPLHIWDIWQATIILIALLVI